METKGDKIKTGDAVSCCPECGDEISSPETDCVYCTEDPDGRDVVGARLDEELMRLRLKELKTRFERTESYAERKKRRRTRRG